MIQTILRDNRENKPWDFSQFGVEMEDVTIETGDYTIPEFCDYDEELETYYPQFAIERKSGNDFAQSISSSRERFKKEIKRASEWSSPLWVVVEAPKKPTRYQEDWLKPYANLSQSHVDGTVESWERYYNVDFQFAVTRGKAIRVAWSALNRKLKNKLFK